MLKVKGVARCGRARRRRPSSRRRQEGQPAGRSRRRGDRVGPRGPAPGPRSRASGGSPTGAEQAREADVLVAVNDALAKNDFLAERCRRGGQGGAHARNTGPAAEGCPSPSPSSSTATSRSKRHPFDPSPPLTLFLIFLKINSTNQNEMRLSGVKPPLVLKVARFVGAHWEALRDALLAPLLGARGLTVRWQVLENGRFSFSFFFLLSVFHSFCI